MITTDRKRHVDTRIVSDSHEIITTFKEFIHWKTYSIYCTVINKDYLTTYMKIKFSKNFKIASYKGNSFQSYFAPGLDEIYMEVIKLLNDDNILSW